MKTVGVSLSYHGLNCEGWGYNRDVNIKYVFELI